ncbi:MAG: cyclic nucleotide-binding domain-containing protein [Anaerolineae bacterium]|nr:cyclic nucleotide-binding domain-containing protein [Anaerolineae bacterium]
MTSDSKTHEYVTILRRTDMFYDLNDEQLRMVADVCLEREYELGQLIFEENTRGEELYAIVSGEVEIRLDTSMIRPDARKGKPVTVATLRRGQTFGEVTLVDQGLRTASAHSASNPTRLLVIPRDSLIDLCEQHPELGYRVMRSVAADLAFKIRGTDLMIREQLLWQPRR